MRLSPELASAIAQEVVLDGYRGVTKDDHHRAWNQLDPQEALNMERTVQRVAHHLTIEADRLHKKNMKHEQL